MFFVFPFSFYLQENISIKLFIAGKCIFFGDYFQNTYYLRNGFFDIEPEPLEPWINNKNFNQNLWLIYSKSPHTNYFILSSSSTKNSSLEKKQFCNSLGKFQNVLAPAKVGERARNWKKVSPELKKHKHWWGKWSHSVGGGV